MGPLHSGPIAFQAHCIPGPFRHFLKSSLGLQKKLFESAHTASNRGFSQSFPLLPPLQSARREGLGTVFPNENYYRWQSVGLGSSLGLAGPGSLAARGGMPVIEFQRTVSSREGFNYSGGEDEFKRPVISDNTVTYPKQTSKGPLARILFYY